MQDVDATRIADARRALAPIDERRARVARRTPPPPRAGEAVEPVALEPVALEDDATVTPTTPVPAVEDAVA